MLTNWQKEKLFPWLQTAIWTLCNVLFVNVCVGIDGCFNLRFCDELAAWGGEYCTGDMCDSKHLVLVLNVTICCRGRVLHPVALALSVLATTVTDRLSLSISRPVPSFLSAVTPLPFGFFKWSLATSYLSHFRYYLQLPIFLQKLYCTSWDFKHVFHHQVVHPSQHQFFLFWSAFTFLNFFQITWLPSRSATSSNSSKYLWKPRVFRQASSYQRLVSDINLQGNVIDLYISEV